MKKTARPRPDPDMRPEYDFAGGIRGKYAARYQEGTNVILLDPDVASAFKGSKAVNRALRALLKTTPRKRASRKRTT